MNHLGASQKRQNQTFVQTAIPLYVPIFPFGKGFPLRSVARAFGSYSVMMNNLSATVNLFWKKFFRIPIRLFAFGCL
ncbi:hypothetical protein CH366_11805 [Leptospira harrisiae]|uniref:Uncharacterized protein n=1 Tax=Leptospira harrisiae TaxID=2023189 RepID=A0A2N0AJ88_9LEPT|nr:hypothetical protein CH364_10105 [Leptospira harrisiae]PKA07118.1 hypothetical protein CH366_11805 [Leptospira harrisiae]